MFFKSKCKPVPEKPRVLIPLPKDPMHGVDLADSSKDPDEQLRRILAYNPSDPPRVASGSRRRSPEDLPEDPPDDLDGMSDRLRKFLGL